MGTEHSPNAWPPNGEESVERTAPPTEPKGDLEPPPRKPPTAVSGPVSGPEPRRPRPSHPWDTPSRQADLPRAVVQAVDAALDVLDAIGDSVRAAASRLAGR